MLTVQQVLQELKKHGITDSDQMVRRWLRQGKIKGERSSYRKEGWRVSEEELQRFISDRKPSQEVNHLRRENERLQGKIKRLNEQIKQLEADHKDVADQFKRDLQRKEKQNEELRAEITHLKTEIEKWNPHFNVTNSNVTHGNITYGNNIDELTQEKVHEIWMEEFQKMTMDIDPNAYEAIIQKAKDSLWFGLFPKNAEKTKLFDRSLKGKRGYRCPFTNKKFASAERLVKSAIPHLIDSYKKKYEQEQQLKKDQQRIEESNRKREELKREGKLPRLF